MMVLLASFCGCAVDAARLYVVNSACNRPVTQGLWPGGGR
jgi:hypothetical protein